MYGGLARSGHPLRPQGLSGGGRAADGQSHQPVRGPAVFRLGRRAGVRAVLCRQLPGPDRRQHLGRWSCQPLRHRSPVRGVSAGELPGFHRGGLRALHLRRAQRQRRPSGRRHRPESAGPAADAGDLAGAVLRGIRPAADARQPAGHGAGTGEQAARHRHRQPRAGLYGGRTGQPGGHLSGALRSLGHHRHYRRQSHGAQRHCDEQQPLL